MPVQEDLKKIDEALGSLAEQLMRQEEDLSGQKDMIRQGVSQIVSQAERMLGLLDNRERVFLEGQCNRLHGLFMHYSTVRMTILAFLVPLGGILISNEKVIGAGLFVVAMAYALNWFFASKSIDRWLKYKNIELWLQKFPNHTYKHVRDDYIPTHPLKLLGFLLGNQAWINQVTFPEAPPDWKKEWTKVKANARLTEGFLQLVVAFGVGMYVDFLFKGPIYRLINVKAKAVFSMMGMV